MYKNKFIKYLTKNKIKNIQKGGFKCAVCQNTGEEIIGSIPGNVFTELYPCAHIICRDCLLNLRRINNNICPLCREVFYINDNLPNDHPLYGEEISIIPERAEIAKKQIVYERQKQNEIGLAQQEEQGINIEEDRVFAEVIQEQERRAEELRNEGRNEEEIEREIREQVARDQEAREQEELEQRRQQEEQFLENYRGNSNTYED